MLKKTMTHEMAFEWLVELRVKCQTKEVSKELRKLYERTTDSGRLKQTTNR